MARNTKELYKKDLHDPYNHDGVITHLEAGILECKVKWALGSIAMNKASGVDGIPVELSVLSMNIQGKSPLGLTGLISLLSKGLSRVFSSMTVQKRQFFGAQPS